MRTKLWQASHRADPQSREIADRHYNRQNIGSTHFVPPGRCLVLKRFTETGQALWVTSYPYAEYVLHRWKGYLVNSLFRNEGAGIASELITEALRLSRETFGSHLSMVTFIDPNHVRPIKRRGDDWYAYTYERAGFVFDGYTKTKKLIAMVSHARDTTKAVQA